MIKTTEHLRQFECDFLQPVGVYVVQNQRINSLSFNIWASTPQIYVFSLFKYRNQFASLKMYKKCVNTLMLINIDGIANKQKH